MQIVQTWHGGCKPTGFDLRFSVRRTHRHGCCQPSLADIDSRASFCNYRDRDHRSSFLRQTRAGGSKQYFASRARSTISGSIFAGRTGFDNRGFPTTKTIGHRVAWRSLSLLLSAPIFIHTGDRPAHARLTSEKVTNHRLKAKALITGCKPCSGQRPAR
jgi:hypothetical protein